ncbi:hypothetical protein LSH36_718g01040 [Paralvinella palmiformis]|uniref:Uncharacterized protein n=1 Tax=Paralvinella palmiformis TaxID=53620 RepID=A0AAD9MT82_9ANNE|nr:hypothetical protein LSH36_718g01040 [Paralvinella palmiformis]
MPVAVNRKCVLIRNVNRKKPHYTRKCRVTSLPIFMHVHGYLRRNYEHLQ